MKKYFCYLIITLCAFLCIYIAYFMLARTEGTNVILISIDTLRASDLGCYGYRRNTSPHIDDFARKSILFKNTFCPQPSTLPSHMSMLTSLYPLAHGVNKDTPLPTGIWTLAGILNKNGYTTAGFATNPGWLNPKYGFYRGFDSYRAEWWNADELNQKVFEWLGRNRRKKIFLFIHYFDVHSDWGKYPYEVPLPFLFTFTDEWKNFGGRKKFSSGHLIKMYKARKTFSDKELAYVKALYDGGIVYVDQAIEKLFNELRRLGLYDNSLIILTADHGEEFQEHGGLLHCQIYNETTHVPLVIKFPSDSPLSKAERIEAIVRTIDIMPTILDFLGFEHTQPLQGRSLLELIAGNPGNARSAYIYNGDGSMRGSDYYAIRDDKWKLIYFTGGERIEMYDLRKDPNEKHDVSDDYPEIAATYRKKLAQWMERMEAARQGLKTEQGTVSLDKETTDKLKALGYIQ